MAKEQTSPTPDDRLPKWKKLWSTPAKLSDRETEDAFDEITDALIPSHMHKLFLKTFGQPKAQFNNRFFNDEAQFYRLETRLSLLGFGDGATVSAIAIYGSPEVLEGHQFRGQSRRTLKDLVIDDWHSVCAIVRDERLACYVFMQAKMKGCIVRISVIDGDNSEAS